MFVCVCVKIVWLKLSDACLCFQAPLKGPVGREKGIMSGMGWAALGMFLEDPLLPFLPHKCADS